MNAVLSSSRVRAAVVAVVATAALSACSDAKKAIGLERTAPDEFVVVSRAPLTVPPDMQSLPKPNPGAVRPQEGSVSDQAAATVFGKQTARQRQATGGAVGGGQSVLLSQAGAKGVDPDVRRKVEQETNQLIVADKSWVDTVLFWRKPAEPVAMVDPKAEAQRLRQLQAEGKPVNDGVVPTIERKRKAPLDGLF